MLVNKILLFAWFVFIVLKNSILSNLIKQHKIIKSVFLGQGVYMGDQLQGTGVMDWWLEYNIKL